MHQNQQDTKNKLTKEFNNITILLPAYHRKSKITFYWLKNN